MRVTTISWMLGPVAAAAFMACLPLGCCSRPEVCKRCEDIPAGAIPQPVGQYACEWQTQQQEEATFGKNMIYEHEWHRGGTELGPFGQRHIEELSQQLSQSTAQVGIEPHFDIESNRMDDRLNEVRRTAIVSALLEHDVPDAEQRVVVARPRTAGLYGQEAASIGNRRLNNGGGRGQTSGGTSLGTGGGGYGNGSTSGGGGIGNVIGGGGIF